MLHVYWHVIWIKHPLTLAFSEDFASIKLKSEHTTLKNPNDTKNFALSLFQNIARYMLLFVFKLNKILPTFTM